jgi:hypothetical protein
MTTTDKSDLARLKKIEKEAAALCRIYFDLPEFSALKAALEKPAAQTRPRLKSQTLPRQG